MPGHLRAPGDRHGHGLPRHHSVLPASGVRTRHLHRRPRSGAVADPSGGRPSRISLSPRWSWTTGAIRSPKLTISL